MSRRILAHHGLIQPEVPTIAQQVDALVGRRIDESLNDPERCTAEAIVGLAIETALTVEHLVELFVARPLIVVLARAVAR